MNIFVWTCKIDFLYDNTDIKILHIDPVIFPDYIKGPPCTYYYQFSLGALLRPILLGSDATFFNPEKKALE